MRIYVSAYRLGRHSGVLARREGRALVVMNALDEYDNRLLNWDREVADLAGLGFRSEELDLREYWNVAPDALRERLRDVDLLWVVGGNAFVLARAAAAANMAVALAGSPHITYAGYSAGACLTSVDLRGIQLMDDASALPSGYSSGMSTETLSLTGTRVIPHAGTAEASAASAFLRAGGHSYVEIADGDDWLIE